jgi:hypothetical protein
VKRLAKFFPLLKPFYPVICPVPQVILMIWIAANQFIVKPFMVLVGHANRTPTPFNLDINILLSIHDFSTWG